MAELSHLLGVLHSVCFLAAKGKGESEREGGREGEKVERKEGDELHSLLRDTRQSCNSSASTMDQYFVKGGSANCLINVST